MPTWFAAPPEDPPLRRPPSSFPRHRESRPLYAYTRVYTAQGGALCLFISMPGAETVQFGTRAAAEPGGSVAGGGRASADVGRGLVAFEASRDLAGWSRFQGRFGEKGRRWLSLRAFFFFFLGVLWAAYKPATPTTSAKTPACWWGIVLCSGSSTQWGLALRAPSVPADDDWGC